MESEYETQLKQVFRVPKTEKELKIAIMEKVVLRLSV